VARPAKIGHVEPNYTSCQLTTHISVLEDSILYSVNFIIKREQF